MSKEFDTIEEALREIQQGRMIVVVDDEDRENEGDLVCAADAASPEVVNFMAKYGRGLICLTLTEQKVADLQLPMMTANNTTALGTNFTVSIEAATGVTTGISAADRSHTIKTAIKEGAGPQDIRTPGHIFPLKSLDGGVLRRTGHSEAGVDFSRLAGRHPSAVICEIMNDDGTMARYDDLKKFADHHGLKMVTIKDLIQYRLQREVMVEPEAEALLPTCHSGDWTIKGYTNKLNGEHYIALVKGEWTDQDEVMVRVHSQCLTGDVFGSCRCDCGPQLHRAMEMIDQAGKGVILYLAQEGRGIGIINKIKAYKLQDEGADTVEANEALGFKPDLRDYGFGAQVLMSLGLHKLKLITNNPRKIVGLEGYGIKVMERVPLEVPTHEHNEGYMQTKKDKMGHMLNNLKDQP